MQIINLFKCVLYKLIIFDENNKFFGVSKTDYMLSSYGAIVRSRRGPKRKIIRMILTRLNSTARRIMYNWKMGIDLIDAVCGGSGK